MERIFINNTLPDNIFLDEVSIGMQFRLICKFAEGTSGLEFA